jgi:hypothetical protein
MAGICKDFVYHSLRTEDVMEQRHHVGASGSGLMTNVGAPILLTKLKTCDLSQTMLTAAQVEAIAAR